MEIKNLFIGLAAVATLVAFSVPASEAKTTKPGTITMYPKTTICLAVNHQTEVVTVTDCNGTEWQFSGCQDFEEGDLIALIMNDNGTPDTIWDDTIITARYSGGTNLFDEVYNEKGD